MRCAARQAENWSQGEAVANAKECSGGNRACQSPQRPVFSTQKVISQIQGSEHVERAADNTDQRQCVLVDSQRKSHASVTAWPLASTRNESLGPYALSCLFGVS